LSRSSIGISRRLSAWYIGVVFLTSLQIAVQVRHILLGNAEVTGAQGMENPHLGLLDETIGQHHAEQDEGLSNLRWIAIQRGDRRRHELLSLKTAD
jgi:hypothetical protein